MSATQAPYSLFSLYLTLAITSKRDKSVSDCIKYKHQSMQVFIKLSLIEYNFGAHCKDQTHYIYLM